MSDQAPSSAPTPAPASAPKLRAPIAAPAPVPSVIAPLIPQTGRRVSAPQPQRIKTLFDATLPEVTTARAKATSTRTSLQAAINAVRAANLAAGDAMIFCAGKTNEAAIFEHEGLTPQVLKVFADLAAPLLEAFTAPAV